jgi:hypothetical protein
MSLSVSAKPGGDRASRGCRVLLLLAVAAIGWAAVACGYSLAGRGNTLPAHIKTIAVPQLVNHSQMPDLDRVMTDAIRQELQTRKRWIVVPEATGTDIDAVVTGTIERTDYSPVALNVSHQASRYVISVTASIQFKDLRDNNKMLWSNPNASARDEVEVTSSTTTSDTAAFLRQNNDAFDRLAKTFAKMVVSSMLEAF